MSTDAEQQAEEIEVLHSIYDGYENFKQVNPTTYQYKYYSETQKTFILEIIWGPTYPTEKPKFNLDIFYNQHLLPSVKEKILSEVNAEAEQWLGYAMTFSIFERLKDKVDEILEEQTEEAVAAKVEKLVITEPGESSHQHQIQSKKPEKKEQLSKSQKRRAWDRAEAGRGGDRPRGSDWYDVIKHLSQTPHQTAN